ncbi:MAG: divalent-cation tolerance protein CutA [Candidatus Baldrarchaeia archaeon]
METPEYVLIITTTPSRESALRIAKVLLDRKLVACVSILENAKSLYWWEGKIEEAVEYVLMIKTTKKKSKSAISVIKKEHPYEVPEAIILPIIDGLEDYLKWIGEVVNDKEEASSIR